MSRVHSKQAWKLTRLREHKIEHVRNLSRKPLYAHAFASCLFIKFPNIRMDFESFTFKLSWTQQFPPWDLGKFYKRKTAMAQTSENILWVISEVLLVFNLLSHSFEGPKFHDEQLQEKVKTSLLKILLTTLGYTNIKTQISCLKLNNFLFSFFLFCFCNLREEMENLTLGEKREVEES